MKENIRAIVTLLIIAACFVGVYFIARGRMSYNQLQEAKQETDRAHIGAVEMEYKLAVTRLEYRVKDLENKLEANQNDIHTAHTEINRLTMMCAEAGLKPVHRKEETH